MAGNRSRSRGRPNSVHPMDPPGQAQKRQLLFITNTTATVHTCAGAVGGHLVFECARMAALRAMQRGRGMLNCLLIIC